MGIVIWAVLTLVLMQQADHGGPCNPSPGEAWAGMGVEFTQVRPSDYPGLPGNISAWLEANSFTIPQSYCDSTVHNAFRAELAGAGAADWAVLASRADSSSIIVFWDGQTDSISVLGQRVDAYYICNGKRYGYPRLILPTAPVEELRRYVELHPPVRIDHACLEDVYCEKYSEVFYWHAGKQFGLIGAD